MISVIARCRACSTLAVGIVLCVRAHTSQGRTERLIPEPARGWIPDDDVAGGRRAMSFDSGGAPRRGSSRRGRWQRELLQAEAAGDAEDTAEVDNIFNILEPLKGGGGNKHTKKSKSAMEREEERRRKRQKEKERIRKEKKKRKKKKKKLESGGTTQLGVRLCNTKKEKACRNLCFDEKNCATDDEPCLKKCRMKCCAYSDDGDGGEKDGKDTEDADGNQKGVGMDDGEDDADADDGNKKGSDNDGVPDDGGNGDKEDSGNGGDKGNDNGDEDDGNDDGGEKGSDNEDRNNGDGGDIDKEHGSNGGDAGGPKNDGDEDGENGGITGNGDSDKGEGPSPSPGPGDTPDDGNKGVESSDGENKPSPSPDPGDAPDDVPEDAPDDGNKGDDAVVGGGNQPSPSPPGDLPDDDDKEIQPGASPIPDDGEEVSPSDPSGENGDGQATSPATAPVPAPAAGSENLFTGDLEVAFGFVFISVENVTAADIMSGKGNTVKADLEGGLALLAPEVAEEAFKTSRRRGLEVGNRRVRRLLGASDGRQRQHQRGRKLLVSFDYDKPPRVNDVVDEDCPDAGSETTFSCYDIISSVTLQLVDEHRIKVEEAYRKALLIAIADGRLDAFMESLDPDGDSSGSSTTSPVAEQETVEVMGEDNTSKLGAKGIFGLCLLGITAICFVAFFVRMHKQSKARKRKRKWKKESRASATAAAAAASAAIAAGSFPASDKESISVVPSSVHGSELSSLIEPPVGLASPATGEMTHSPDGSVDSYEGREEAPDASSESSYEDHLKAQIAEASFRIKEGAGSLDRDSDNDDGGGAAVPKDPPSPTFDEDLTEAVSAMETGEAAALPERGIRGGVQREGSVSEQDDLQPTEEEERAAAEAEAMRLQEEQARIKAEEEERIRAETEAGAAAEEQARIRREEEERAAAEAEAMRLQEEQARMKAEEEERIRAEAEARAAAEEQARREEVERAAAEAEAIRLQEEQARMKAEEEERIRAEAAARAAAEEQARSTSALTSSASVSASVTARVEAEIERLPHDIVRVGTGQYDGVPRCTFGDLFDDDEVQQHYEALVGTLKSAKKRGLITFKGQMLLKGVSDGVVIEVVDKEALAEV